MSDKDRQPPYFRNEETVRRRAWIDRALVGVRESLRAAEAERSGILPPAETRAEVPAEGIEAAPAARPTLFLVRNR